MKHTERFNHLLDRYLNNRLSFKEKGEFFELIATGDFDDIIENQFESDFYAPDDHAENLTCPANDAVIKTILHAEKSGEAGLKNKKYGYRFWLSVAASVLFVISLLIFNLFSSATSSKTFIAAFKKNSGEKVTNSTSLLLPVSLPDGSIVTLQPNSSLYYSVARFASNREVCMEGEAVFKIAKDSLSPFYVYYRDIVTKVLGTSFNIGTDINSGNVEVKVFTGKVWVYENAKIYDDVKTNSGVILTPNQKAVYKDTKRILQAKLVDKPLLINAGTHMNINGKTAQPDFNYSNEKLSAVLKNIEVNYGIAISAVNEKIYNCEFSGDLTKEDLFDKLKIICLATHSEYEIKGTTISIKGEGCQ